MSIISQTTWDKFDPTEQKEIRELYSALLNALKQEQIGSEEHLRLSSIQDRYISLFGRENLQPKPLTYEDVARELFGGKKIMTVECHFTSYKQAEKLLAINKLMNVAAYLNKNEDGTPWKPDWENLQEKKWYPSLSDSEIKISYVMRDSSSPVYFRTEELALQAIQILGEETVRLALSSDF